VNGGQSDHISIVRADRPSARLRKFQDVRMLSVAPRAEGEAGSGGPAGVNV
jgi:hypothetical protein